MTEMEKPGQVRVAYSELVDLLERIFSKGGMSESTARLIAENCAACERDGCHSHGIFRVPGYLNSLRSEWVDGKATPDVEEVGRSFLRIDARNGFAQVALAHGLMAAVEMTVKNGVAVVAIKDSHHFSALWPDLEPMVSMGFVAITMVAGLKCVTPPGGVQPVFGTNPIAFGTPVGKGNPLIFDFATSAMSNGDLRLAARAGKKVPLGTGVNSEGKLVRDPDSILGGGALLPFGGHKGAAITLMVEVLASALTGGQFSSEVDFSAHPGAETPKTGQVLIIIDPSRGGNGAFADRVLGLTQIIRRAGQERLPSDRRYKTRQASERRGIALPNEKYEELKTLAR